MAKKQDNFKRQNPAYRLYTADFLVRTYDMTNEQVGMYTRLLCYQHQNGHLTEITMKSFCNGRDEKVFSKFQQDANGLYYNEEMENEVMRRAEVSKSKSDNAKKRLEQENNEIDTYISEYDSDM